jgi:AraC-like DNA-binding protein
MTIADAFEHESAERPGASRLARRVLSSSTMTRRTRPPRIFTHAHRQRLDRAAEHYLRDCYRRKTAARASEFATFLRVTHEYLSSIAPKIAGKGLRDLLREKQLASAVRLLRNTPLHIEEIALRCGFGTVSTFYRWFQAQYGMPPGKFREIKK